MKVAIIGTGNMASGLASTLAGANHNVAIGSRDPAKAAALAEKVGQESQGGGIAAATRLADIVIPSLTAGLAIIVMWKYDLNEERAQQIKAELVRRRGEL